MRLRRAVALLFAVPILVACGDDGEPDGEPEGGADSASVTEDEEVARDACSLLTTDEVSIAVGVTVADGLGGDGPVVTGGFQSTCTWRGLENPSAVATVTVYTETSAADSVRTEDSVPLPELGENAFVGPFASVWAYAGVGSYTAQWYDFAASDEENLPKSTALALLVLDAL